MNPTSLYFEHIKGLLKARGLTYRDVGRHLGLSEPSVKRIFSLKNLDLKRLLKLCDLLEMSLDDVIRTASSRETQSRLSSAQEQMLVRDQKLFVFFLLLQRRWSVREILTHYRFSNPEVTRFLLHLEKNGIIEVKPGDKVKLKFGDPLEWISDGPVERMYENVVKREFLDHKFNHKNDRLTFVLREVSPATYNALLRRIDKFVADADLLAKADQTLAKQETQSMALIVGMRPWILSIVETYKR